MGCRAAGESGVITQDAIVNLNLLPGDQLEIEWVDARYLSGWHDRQEILSWERDFNKHRSTGFFVFANDDNILLGEMWAPEGWEKRQVGGINAIPLNAILGVWRLMRVDDPGLQPIMGIETIGGVIEPLSRTDARVGFGDVQSRQPIGGFVSEGDVRFSPSPKEGEPDNAAIAALALDWRAAERAYQKCLAGEHTSRIDDIELSQVAGKANQAMRLALDQRLAAEDL